jgi:hypothetical protein
MHILRAVRGAAILTGGVVLFLAGSAAHAVTFNASFAPIKIAAKPGQVLTTNYRLALDDADPRTHFKVEVQDWWRSEDGRQSFYAPAGSISRSCGHWVSANPMEATVSGGQALQIRLTVSIPQDVKPGGYWCALSVDEMPDPLAVEPEGVGVRFLASVSTGVYVYIDPVERGADVLDIEVDGAQATARIENTGNTPTAVEGRFEFLRAGESKPAVVVTLPRNMLLTEPVRTAAFSVPLPSPLDLPSGRYTVRLILDIGLDHYIGFQRALDIVRNMPAAARD